MVVYNEAFMFTPEINYDVLNLVPKNTDVVNFEEVKLISRDYGVEVEAIIRNKSDIHRDAIEYEDGSHVSAVTEIDGKKAAQVMIISAADEGSYDIPNYLGNLHFACEFQQALEQNYSGLTRPVLFQYCQYNQQVSTGSLLVEVGSHGNTVEQAVYSGHLIGKALSGLLMEKAEEGDKSDVRERATVMPLYFIERLR